MFAFADVWEAVARARGDAPAQVQGDRRVTWSEFDRRADAVASALLETGAGHQAHALAPWTGLAVFCAYAAAALLVAGFLLTRRDA